MQRIASNPDGSGPDQASLFVAPSRPTFTAPSTSTLAGESAARNSGRMCAKIIEFLRKGPATLFETAAHLNVPDHTISGRFSDLARDLRIERTGDRKPKPESGLRLWTPAGMGVEYSG